MRLCNDWDLLRREPGLLREARPVASRLVSLNTTFTGVDGVVTGMPFDGDTPVRPGMLAWVVQRELAGVVIGVGPQRIAVALPHDALPPAAETDAPELEAGPGAGGVTTEVWTFPQTSAASVRVARTLGVPLGTLLSLTLEDTAAAADLRDATAHIALAAVFAGLAALDRTLVNDTLGRGFTFSDTLWRLSQRHERLGAAAMRQLALQAGTSAVRPGTALPSRG